MPVAVSGQSPMPTTRAKRPPGPRVADSDDEPQAPAAKRVRRRGAMITLGTDFGGLETPRLALLNLGYHVRRLFTSEWDKHCVKLSQCLFSDIKKRYGDVAERGNNAAQRVDVYAAGVSCCSWAACGPGTGLADIIRPKVEHVEVGELLGDGLGPGLTDVVGAEEERVEVGEILGNRLGTGIADVIEAEFEHIEVGKILGNSLGPGIADVVIAEEEQLEVGEVIGDGHGTSVADVV